MLPLAHKANYFIRSLLLDFFVNVVGSPELRNLFYSLLPHNDLSNVHVCF